MRAPKRTIKHCTLLGEALCESIIFSRQRLGIHRPAKTSDDQNRESYPENGNAFSFHVDQDSTSRPIGYVRIHIVKSFKSRLEYYIGDIVYGANDGIITTFAVIAGAAGAGFSSGVIIVLGIANLIADGFSMGASRFLSLQSEQAVAGAEHDRSAFYDGIATFLSFIAAGSLPLIPFLLGDFGAETFRVSAFATAGAFFLVGAARSLVIEKNPVVAGLEMLIVGGIASTIAYGLGSWVEMLVR